MDTRVCDAEISLAQDVDLLVTESTFLNCDEDKAARHWHLTAGQAGAIANKANTGKLLLTHFSQRYDKGIDFTKDAKAIHHDVLQMNDSDIYDL